jgi:two-component system sensor histidine kinase BaeS
MNFSIKYKLLLTFVVATVAVVGVMLSLMIWSFERGFLQYVNTIEVESRNQLLAILEYEYESTGGWDALQKDGRRWRELQFSAYARSLNLWRQSNPEQERRVTEPRPAVSEQKPLDNTSHPETQRENDSYEGGYRYSRLILLDQGKNLLIGRVRDMSEMELKPINIQGKPVGYLGIRPSRQLTDYYDLRFSEEQGREFLLIALATLVIATILILPLSRSLVKPINRLTVATRDLNSGNYKVRIPVHANDEIGQLSRDFNSLANTLEQNENARRRWIADISHELRTPLTILRGEIEAIQDGVRTVNPERLNALHNEVMNLNRLISDLYELSLSDIGALSYHKRSVDAVDIINTSLAALADDFKEKNIRVSVHPDSRTGHSLRADPDRLQQLFTNLLTNSLRYTDTGGELRIALGVEKGKLVIGFQDSGPGVNDADLPRLFERLYRVDSSRNRMTGGAGLGLSICRSIVEAHAGTISAQRSQIGGLWIKIELPIEA